MVANDDVQHAAATALIEGDLTQDAPSLVHPVALCELVWVLRSVYRVPKPEIVAALRLVLSVRTLRVIDAASVRQALDLYEAHAADFADALLSVRYHTQGSALATFDRGAAQLPGAQQLGEVATDDIQDA